MTNITRDTYNKFEARFALKQITPSKVAEISKTTAESDCPVEERINLHIGNPVQDPLLDQMYAQLVLGTLSNSVTRLNWQDWQQKMLQTISKPSRRKIMKLIFESIEKANPYMPRGGFNPKKPGTLVRQIQAWLTIGQDEPLDYSLNSTGNSSEIAIAGGGKLETLKLLFQVIEENLKSDFKNIIALEETLSASTLRAYSGKTFTIQGTENRLLEQIQNLVTGQENTIGFILIQKIYSREFRNKLAALAVTQNLMIFEANDAANVCSLARNPGMASRLLRILTPAAIDSRLSNSGLAFILGNARFIEAFNLLHFLKKGTPSASEVKLLSFLLNDQGKLDEKLRNEILRPKSVSNQVLPVSEIVKKTQSANFTWTPNFTCGPSLERISVKIAGAFEQTLKQQEKRIERIIRQGENYANNLFKQHFTDIFSGKSTWEVIHAFFDNLENSQFAEALAEAFLTQFTKMHPEMNPAFMLALSGSARTALSSMVEAWGISEAVVPDLSWTLGDAIPKITAVPLHPDLTVCAKNIIRKLESKLNSDPDWPQYGCVILNNPQNATGKISAIPEIQAILTFCLSNGIRVIDDLSYANMIIQDPASRQKRADVKNCRQLANELVANGQLSPEALKHLTTIRSISKTDCKAGVRLCVVEIPDPVFFQEFKVTVSEIEPNRMALLLTYLFYRNTQDKLNQFSMLRDKIQWERMQALLSGLNEIPPSKNIFNIQIVAPEGAMYPHLLIQKLPENVNIDDLSTKLASKGIGLIPLTTFAKTKSSYAYAAGAFRLTLGGSVGSKQCKKQVYRLISEITGEIQRQAYDYTFYQPPLNGILAHELHRAPVQHFVRQCAAQFNLFWEKIEKEAQESRSSIWQTFSRGKKDTARRQKLDFISSYLPYRKQDLLPKLTDRALLISGLRENFANPSLQEKILGKFFTEINATPAEERRKNFQQRLFDRTVHPTQLYSIQVESVFNALFQNIISGEKNNYPKPDIVFQELKREYFAENIAIQSALEATEAVFDLNMITQVEDFSDYFCGNSMAIVYSLWGDWDGSRRPSGQGHTLVAGALLANVLRLARFARFLQQENLIPNTGENYRLLTDITQIEQKINKFIKILEKISKLTTALEARYRKHLETDKPPGRLTRLLRKLKLARDPVQVMWRHNDRNERRMQAFRKERSAEILRFFKLNYELCKLMQQAQPELRKHIHHPALLEYMAKYKNPLKRFYLTPRIHQKIITSDDSFAIDSTVYNLVEINQMGAQFGYPGLVQCLQVSMTNRADAIIRLDKKIREEWERIFREDPSILPVQIRLVPLFEEIEVLEKIEEFLDQIWDYAEETKALGQTVQRRFCEIIGEFFVAGSDLSQQLSQPQALVLFKQTKARINTYLLKKGLAGQLRIKFGTGEPAQRQGGYFDDFAARKVFEVAGVEELTQKLAVDDFTAEALFRARSPLNGIFSTSDFRTFQSNLMERLRQLPAEKVVNTFYHIQNVQTNYEGKINALAEMYWGSRRRLQEEMSAQLDVLMKGQLAPSYLQFAGLVQNNFKHILYGSPEDMTGIHVVSYFISRALLSVRDRPTVRPAKETGEDRGRQIVEHLSGTLPLSEHGTLLRAIGHNKAQTMILGINQLSTGIFRSMREFVESGKNADEQIFKLQKEILPHLPVKDILNSLRLYQDPAFSFLQRLETAFPPGNSALKALKEEQRVMHEFLPLLQTELQRRNGLGKLSLRANGNAAPNRAALRTIRPDLAVLLQPDIFNTDIQFFSGDSTTGIREPASENLLPLENELSRRRIISTVQHEIWEFMTTPIYEQVQSFFELAQAIKALRSEGKIVSPKTNVVSRSQISRMGAEINRMLRNVADDSMRQFLISTVQYLLYLPETVEDIPEAVLIALRDMKKIIRLDEQALSLQDQKYLHFLFVKIARVGGESG